MNSTNPPPDGASAVDAALAERARGAAEEPALFFPVGWEWRWWSWGEWGRRTIEGGTGGLALPGGEPAAIDWRQAADEARELRLPALPAGAVHGRMARWLGAVEREVVVEVEPLCCPRRGALLLWAVSQRAATVLTSRERWLSTVRFARPTLLWGEVDLLVQLESALLSVRGESRRRRRLSRLRAFRVVGPRGSDAGRLLVELGVDVSEAGR